MKLENQYACLLFKLRKRAETAIGFGIILLILACLIGPASSMEERPNAFSVTAVYTVTVPFNGVQVTREGPVEKAAGAEPQRQQGGEVTPSINQINCQQPATQSVAEELEKQEQAARDLEKAVVGLEIAQGAIEITLGAIRIAGAGTTADLIRRQDAIASSRIANGVTAPLGFEGIENPPTPIRFDAAARKDAAVEAAARKTVCAQVLRRSQVVLADNPYTSWNNGYRARIKRSAVLGSLISEEMHNFVKPTPSSNQNSITDANSPLKLPTTEEAEQLLKLLENLLDTNNEVLRLLGIDLPPLTNQPTNPGAILLHQYKQRLERQKQIQQRYAETGYLDEEAQAEANGQDSRWRSSVGGRRADVHTLTSELAQLTRMRRRLNTD